jgi:hypothetical protein
VAAEFLHLGEPAPDLDQVAPDAFANFATSFGCKRRQPISGPL